MNLVKQCADAVLPLRWDETGHLADPCEQNDTSSECCPAEQTLSKRCVAAIMTNDEVLYVQIGQLFEAQGDHHSTLWCRDSLDLNRQLMREQADLLIVDIRAYDDVGMLIEWRKLHHLDRLPILLIHLDANTAHWMDALSRNDDVAWGAHPTEVLVRGKRLIEHATAARELDRVEVGRYALDRSTSLVTIDSETIVLTEREFKLAWVLFSNSGTTINRDTIASIVWNKGANLALRSLGQHIYRLRGKLSMDGSRGVLLRAIYGVGYRIELIKDGK